MISIVLGSTSDSPLADKCKKVLEDFSIPCEIFIASAHRNPEKLEEIVKNSNADIFIAIAGLSAALPGAIAARTTKPVIAVPVNVKLEGLDALLSSMQMPKGIPVASVGIDNAENAALLAIEMLVLKDKTLKKRLDDYRKNLKKLR